MDTIYFLLAVAAVSAVIFVLSMRADRRKSSDGGSSDPGISPTSDGWTTSWFGSNHFGPSTDLFSGPDSAGGWSGGDSSSASRGSNY